MLIKTLILKTSNKTGSTSCYKFMKNLDLGTRERITNPGNHQRLNNEKEDFINAINTLQNRAQTPQAPVNDQVAELKSYLTSSFTNRTFFELVTMSSISDIVFKYKNKVKLYK